MRQLISALGEERFDVRFDVGAVQVSFRQLTG
jgi:hypothetical protein